MPGYIECPIVFNCEGNDLLGICHTPDDVSPTRGVVIVVGGPQYRVGSHRQFVIMARDLCGQGIPVFRFDLAGMGDSQGVASSFENVTPNIKCAVDTFFKQVPGLDEVVLWGLCDGATAAGLYAHQDKRIRGLVLVNPWVRTEKGEAKTYLRHHYVPSLFSFSFWRRLVTGRINVVRSISSLTLALWKLMFRRKLLGKKDGAENKPLPQKLYAALNEFVGDVLVILSGQDYTAAEFEDLLKGDQSWGKMLSSHSYQLIRFKQADHTFSVREALNNMSESTVKWIKGL